MINSFLQDIGYISNLKHNLAKGYSFELTMTQAITVAILANQVTTSKRPASVRVKEPKSSIGNCASIEKTDYDTSPKALSPVPGAHINDAPASPVLCTASKTNPHFFGLLIAVEEALTALEDNATVTEERLQLRS